MGNGSIRKISPEGTRSTFAGSGARGLTGGTGTEAIFHQLCGVTTDPSGHPLVAGTGNNGIRSCGTFSVQPRAELLRGPLHFQIDGTFTGR